MAAPVTCGFPILNDGATFNGLLTRTNSVAAQTLSTGTSSTISARGGVLPAAGAEPLLVSPATGMQVTVNPGFAIIQSAVSNLQGAYRMGLLSQGTITLDASNVTNPRIDLVVAQVIDPGDATSVSQIAVLTGTPAPSPAAPSLTGLHVTVLAQIAVGANVSSIVLANITDRRQFTTHPTGVLHVTSQAQRDAITNPFDGMKIYRRDTGNEELFKKTPNAWVLIGQVTDSGWIAFPTASGYSANAGSPAYRKVQNGPQPRVYLRGSLRLTPAGFNFDLPSGAPVGILPTGFRPLFDVFIACSTQYTTQSTCRVQISASTGQVTFQGPHQPAWVSMDGVDFEQGN